MEKLAAMNITQSLKKTLNINLQNYIQYVKMYTYVQLYCTLPHEDIHIPTYI